MTRDFIIETLKKMDDTQLFAIATEYVDASGNYSHVIYTDEETDVLHTIFTDKELENAIRFCEREGIRYNESDEYVSVDTAHIEKRIETANHVVDLIPSDMFEDIADYFIANKDDMPMLNEYLKMF